jgi:hypothetical protein
MRPGLGVELDKNAGPSTQKLYRPWPYKRDDEMEMQKVQLRGNLLLSAGSNYIGILIN